MGHRLRVELTQQFIGDRDKIIETLAGVGDMLQAEVDLRAARMAAEPVAVVVSPKTFTGMLSPQLDRLAKLFSTMGQVFEDAAKPSGGPEMFRRAYADFLDALLTAKEAMWAIQAADFPKTQRIFRDFVKSFYQQVALWPKLYRDSARKVRGDRYELTVRAEYDISSLQRTLERETVTAVHNLERFY